MYAVAKQQHRILARADGRALQRAPTIGIAVQLCSVGRIVHRGISIVQHQHLGIGEVLDLHGHALGIANGDIFVFTCIHQVHGTAQRAAFGVRAPRCELPVVAGKRESCRQVLRLEGIDVLKHRVINIQL